MTAFMLDVTDRHEAEDELRSWKSSCARRSGWSDGHARGRHRRHDFKQYPRAILGYGEMALRDAPEGSRLRRDLDSITGSGERGPLCVECILAFSSQVA